MLKIFMNEPYSTEHELIQAKRLVELLNESYADDEHAWLCLNFSFGGKALDGAFITPECFTIIEFKAVGGDVYCGDSIESSTWKWKLYPHDLGQSISTSPYANPYSQVKCYRTALIGDLAQRQQGFIGKKRLLKEDVDFYMTPCLFGSGQAEPIYLISKRFYKLLKDNKMLRNTIVTPAILV